MHAPFTQAVPGSSPARDQARGQLQLTKNANPWASEALRTLRRNYHRALCAWLSQPGGIHRVEKAFVWSYCPWDPQGVENDAFMVRANNTVQASNGTAGK